MGHDLIFTGNLPVETPEQAFRMFGKTLGRYLQALPDGEAGYRNFWVQRLIFQIFHGHPDIVTLSRPISPDGLEVLAPGGSGKSVQWSFKLRGGVKELRFTDPGWRLGFTYDALTSYSTFRLLREMGELPDDLRFQVSMPLVNSTVNKMRFAIKDIPTIRRGYSKALAAEAQMIADKIPHEDLAISWDCSREISALYENDEGADLEESLHRSTDQFAQIMPLIPSKVQIGVHLCFGTYGGWPRFSPPDLSRIVAFANAIVDRSGRRIDWIHIPILPTTDDKFFAPLKNLRTGPRIYLGLIHTMDQFKARYEVAKKYLPDFGLAGYCGFGGGRRSREEAQAIIDDHLTALKLAGKL